jgi:hypothetical protein
MGWVAGTAGSSSFRPDIAGCQISWPSCSWGWSLINRPRDLVGYSTTKEQPGSHKHQLRLRATLRANDSALGQGRRPPALTAIPSLIPRKMEKDYKSLKEDFVSNLSGGPITEINYVTAVAPVCTMTLHHAPY